MGEWADNDGQAGDTNEALHAVQVPDTNAWDDEDDVPYAAQFADPDAEYAVRVTDDGTWDDKDDVPYAAQFVDPDAEEPAGGERDNNGSQAQDIEKDDAYGDDPGPDKWGAADVPRRGGEEDPEQAPDAPYQGDPPPDPTSPPGAEALGEERD